MHTWELAPIYFDYYFFDENCSYYLLELLEAARPDLDLTRGFRWWALPSDTVREVIRQQGLLKRVVYRPSNATVIRHRLELMSPEERTFVNEMGRGRISTRDSAYAALPETAQARVLEWSHDYLNYLRVTGRSSVDEPATLARDLLLERSRLGAGPYDPPVPVPEVRPDQGHGTSRIALGAGRRDRASFIELRARPSYHDLMDPDGGYARAAQTEFFDLAVRDYGTGIGPRLEDLRLVNIVSISPRNEFFRSLSWKIDAGWARRRLAGGDEPLVFGVHGGPGLAWTVPDSLKGNTTIYAFLESTAEINKHLEKGFALGAGPSFGALTDLSPRWRAEDGLELYGWFLPAKGSPLGTILHLHGNAENISTHFAGVAWMPARGFNVFVFDYRGYGASEGQPDLEGAQKDIDAAMRT